MLVPRFLANISLADGTLLVVLVAAAFAARAAVLYGLLPGLSAAPAQFTFDFLQLSLAAIGPFAELRVTDALIDIHCAHVRRADAVPGQQRSGLDVALIEAQGGGMLSGNAGEDQYDKKCCADQTQQAMSDANCRSRRAAFLTRVRDGHDFSAQRELARVREPSSDRSWSSSAAFAIRCIARTDSVAPVIPSIGSLSLPAGVSRASRNCRVKKA